VLSIVDRGKFQFVQIPLRNNCIAAIAAVSQHFVLDRVLWNKSDLFNFRYLTRAVLNN
jgi:hypothetical protein